MTARGSTVARRLRAAGGVLGAAGWATLAGLIGSRMSVGAPHDNGLLAAGLAGALALMLTSAMLIIVDTLRVGFGALDSFFSAALARASQRRVETMEKSDVERARRGYIGDRPFVVNDDGTVTVETLLGPRHFPSLADAQDFVGS